VKKNGVTYSNPIVDVGVYTFEIVLNDSNYTLNGCIGSVGASYEVTPQDVVIYWYGDGTQLYNGSSYSVTASVIGSTDGKNVDFSYNGTNSFSQIGEHTVSIKLNDSNYRIADVANASTTLEIVS
jgi:hypothetical protein